MQSMTGYGRGVAVSEGREITVEARSVNHRFLDLAFRMPRSLAFLEDALRKLLQQTLTRGHIDVYVTYMNLREDARELRVNEALVQSYRQAAAQIVDLTGAQDDMRVSHWLRLPDVLSLSEAHEDEAAIQLLAQQALEGALAQLTGMRMREGAHLAQDLEKRAQQVLALCAGIEQRAPLVVEEYRRRLSQRIEELLQPDAAVDADRLAVEVAVFADRASITEELVRLKSHVIQFDQALKAGVPTGRKLDFIVQEMNREANTIGSKASDRQIAAHVVDLKSEIEKIREQVQNIE